MIEVALQIGAVVVATASTNLPADVVASPTDGEALRPAKPRALIAEGLARVRSAGQGGPEPERAEDGAGDDEAESPQRFAARQRFLGEGFREFVPVV
jgi:hypothetical protein